MAPGKWGTSDPLPLACASRWVQDLELTEYTDDEEEDSSAPSSPGAGTAAPVIARRSKFDDEEDDSDVRQPTMPRACIISTPPCTNMYTDYQRRS
jgi:hypothetical protein